MAAAMPRACLPRPNGSTRPRRASSAALPRSVLCGEGWRRERALALMTRAAAVGAEEAAGAAEGGGPGAGRPLLVLAAALALFPPARGAAGAALDAAWRTLGSVDLFVHAVAFLAISMSHALSFTGAAVGGALGAVAASGGAPLVLLKLLALSAAAWAAWVRRAGAVAWYLSQRTGVPIAIGGLEVDVNAGGGGGVVFTRVVVGGQEKGAGGGDGRLTVGALGIRAGLPALVAQLQAALAGEPVVLDELLVSSVALSATGDEVVEALSKVLRQGVHVGRLQVADFSVEVQGQARVPGGGTIVRGIREQTGAKSPPPDKRTRSFRLEMLDMSSLSTAMTLEEIVAAVEVAAEPEDAERSRAQRLLDQMTTDTIDVGVRGLEAVLESLEGNSQILDRPEEAERLLAQGLKLGAEALTQGFGLAGGMAGQMGEQTKEWSRAQVTAGLRALQPLLQRDDMDAVAVSEVLRAHDSTIGWIQSGVADVLIRTGTLRRAGERTWLLRWLLTGKTMEVLVESRVLPILLLQAAEEAAEEAAGGRRGPGGKGGC